MSIFSHIQTNANVQATKDSLGGFNLVETGVYNCIIDSPYVEITASGATMLKLTLQTDTESVNLSLFLASGEAGGFKNYFEYNGKPQLYKGFVQAQELAQLVTGESLEQLVTEKKVVDIWDNELKQKIPQEREMFMSLHGKPIAAGIFKMVKNKQQKGDDGKYTDLPETRESNELDKFFHPETRHTVAELEAKLDTADFVTQWENKYSGKTQDRSKTVKGAATANPSTAPAKGLFNK